MAGSGKVRTAKPLNDLLDLRLNNYSLFIHVGIANCYVFYFYFDPHLRVLLDY